MSGYPLSEVDLLEQIGENEVPAPWGRSMTSS